MQIDHHIRMCPVIAEAGGLEPYPQPMAAFAGAPTGTVQARIFDVSVQPPVELTSGGAIALASGLAASGLTNIPNSYVLDMGNASVTSIVDAYTREGLEVVVMFEDSGGSQSPRYVKVTCNDADHVDALYPDGAIYAVANSGNTGTGFPNGSIYLPCQNLGDACSILSSRGAEILDCAGSWNGGGSGSGGVLQADIGSALSAARATIRTRSTAAWYPHNAGDIIDLVDCKVVSVNVPYGFAIATFTNGTYFAGAPKLVNCRIQTIYFTGNGGSRYGALDAVACKIDGDVFLSGAQSPGCWAADAVGCINGGSSTIDCSSNSGSTLSWVGCSGAWTIANMAAGKAISMTGISGMPDITLAASTSNAITVTLTGAYNSLVNNTGGALSSLTERKLAAIGDAMDLVADAVDTTSLADDAITAAKLANGAIDNATFAAGAIDNAAIAAGAITATEAPNLDAAVSSRAVAGDAMALTAGAVDGIWDEATAGHVTAGTYGVAVTDVLTDTAAIQPTIAANLDAAVSTRATQTQVATELTNYDAATGTEAAAISAAIAALPDSAAVQTAAEAAITAQEPIAANVTQVASSAVTGVADFRADVSALATAAALALVQTSADAAARAGDAMTLTAGERTAIATAVHGLPVYWAVDGGANNATIDYSSDYPAQVRLRGWIDDETAATNATYGAADDADGEDLRYVLSGTQVSGKAYASQWRKTGTSA